MTKTTNYSKISIAILLTVAIIYIFSLLKFTINIPYEDDYLAILKYLNDFNETTTIQEKINLIFSQHNEHRIAFNRIIELIQLKIFGEVNFLFLTLFGNLGWFLVIYLLWRFSEKKGISLLEFSPVAVLLLSFSHNELMPWAMASIQQYYQILFSLLAIWFLVERKNGIALLWLTTSMFTGSGGLVLIPVFALYHLSKRDFKNLIIFTIYTSILLSIFFIALEYKHPPHHPSILDALRKPLALAQYFFVFLGSAFGSKNLALASGLSLFLIFLINFRKAFVELPFLFWSVIFIFGTALITGLARSGFGIEQALSSRYTHYSLMILALIYTQYIYILIDKKKKLLLYFFLVFFTLLFSSWLIKGGETMNTRLNNLKNNGIYYTPSVQVAEEILKKSHKNGHIKSLDHIKLPSRIFQVEAKNISNVHCVSIDTQLNLCSNGETAHHSLPILVPSQQKSININGWTIDNNLKDGACGAYITINDNKINLSLSERKDVSKAFSNPKYLMSGFNFNIDISKLPDGTYPLKLRTISSDCGGYYDTFEVDIVKGTHHHRTAPNQN